MTKSAIEFRKLAENERHNAEQERLGKQSNRIALITGLAGAFAKPMAQIIAKDKPDIKAITKADMDKFNALKATRDSGTRLSGPDFKFFKTIQSLLEKGVKVSG